MGRPEKPLTETADHCGGSAATARLQRILDAWNNGPSIAIEGLEAKLEQVFGLIPLFPDQFVYVVNYTEARVVYSRGVEEVLGYKAEEVDIPWVTGTWHPDDAPIVARLSEAVLRQVQDHRPVLRPFDLNLLVDYRVRKADGTYIKILRQSTVFAVDERTGRAISTFSICKDISNIKSSDRVGWQLSGPAAAAVDMSGLKDLHTQLQYRPSPREMDVLRKLVKGRSSARIAEELHISVHTVNTHRRNLLERTGLENTAELVRMASEAGWV